jgi:hypothetical protein
MLASVPGYLIQRGGQPSLMLERSAVLFLITSAVNVITVILAGSALFFGILPGPSNPLLSGVPAGVEIVVLVFFSCCRLWRSRGGAP